ncbi:MAG: hypothetical protein AB1714_05465 [Acidobacteriota bacterium]
MEHQMDERPASRSTRWGWSYGLTLGLLIWAWSLYRPAWWMPSALSESHAGLDANCGNCHVPYRGVAVARCLNCHADFTAADSPSPLHRDHRIECPRCHVEHRTRDYPLRFADPRGFDHSLTGFPLGRRHQRLQCTYCHKDLYDYFHVPATCPECHSAWNSTNFRHDQVVGIPLVIHKELECQDCHTGRLYDQKPACGNCHGEEVRYQPGMKL